MPAFIDVSCPKCHKKFGWFGEIKNRPPCPKCGFVISKSELENDEKHLNDLRTYLIAIADLEDQLETIKSEIQTFESFNMGLEFAKLYCQDNKIDFQDEIIKEVVRKFRNEKRLADQKEKYGL